MPDVYTEGLGLAGLSIIITKLCLCFVYFEPNLFLSGAALSHLFVHMKMLLHSSLNYLGSNTLFLLHTNFLWTILVQVPSVSLQKT